MSRNPKKIPASAKKVFSGIIFDVWQWEQKMFDGSMTTFERVARPDTVEVLAVTDDNKILILNQEQPDKPPFLSLPGGRVEDGEEPETAIKRELLEETGYTAHSWELYTTVKPVGKLDWTIHTYIARGAKKYTNPSLDPGEKIVVEEYSFDDFLLLLDEERFHEPELKIHLMKARYDEAAKKNLYKKLFNS